MGHIGISSFSQGFNEDGFDGFALGRLKYIAREIEINFPMVKVVPQATRFDLVDYEKGYQIGLVYKSKTHAFVASSYRLLDTEYLYGEGSEGSIISEAFDFVESFMREVDEEEKRTEPEPVQIPEYTIEGLFDDDEDSEILKKNTLLENKA